MRHTAAINSEHGVLAPDCRLMKNLDSEGLDTTRHACAEFHAPWHTTPQHGILVRILVHNFLTGRSVRRCACKPKYYLTRTTEVHESPCCFPTHLVVLGSLPRGLLLALGWAPLSVQHPCTHTHNQYQSPLCLRYFQAASR